MNWARGAFSAGLAPSKRRAILRRLARIGRAVRRILPKYGRVAELWLPVSIVLRQARKNRVLKKVGR